MTTQITTDDVISYLNIHVNWDKFFTLINVLNDSLNSRKNRFDKGTIIEKSLETYSDGNIEHIDAIGRDHRITEFGVDIEFKFKKDGILTKKGKTHVRKACFKLTNSNGENKSTEINNPADFYLFCQQDAIAIMKYTDMEEIEDCFQNTKDGWRCKIPGSELKFIKMPGDFKILNTDNSVNYVEEKNSLINKFINSIGE
tara:strand:+ start:2225 stop:2821 length:597 start_codon:yes stop_codon:yes gene_type:complete